MSTLSAGCFVLGCVGFLCAAIGILTRVYDRGAKIGRQQGYEQGFSDGQFRMHQWWLEADRDVERAREEMWREGL